MKVSKKDSRKNDMNPVSPMDPQVSFTTKRSQKQKKKKKEDAVPAKIISTQRDISSKATEPAMGTPAADENRPTILGTVGSTSKGHDNKRLLAEYSAHRNAEQHDGGKGKNAEFRSIDREGVAPGELRESSKRNEIEEQPLITHVGPKQLAPVSTWILDVGEHNPRSSFVHPIVNKKKRGRPRKDTLDGLPIDPLPPSKKKRGRPKKNASERPPLLSPDEPCEGGQASLQPIAAPGGSMRKGNSERPAMGSDVAQSAAGQQMKQTKKRGRPKNVASEQPPLMSHDEPREEAKANPKPIAAAPEGLMTKGKSEQPVMRFDVAQSTTGQQMIPTKKRGRPKKVASEQPPLMSHDEPREEPKANSHPIAAPGGSMTEGKSEQPAMGSNVSQSTAGQQKIPTKKRGRPKKDRTSKQSPRMSPDDPREEAEANPQPIAAPGGSRRKGNSERPAMGSDVSQSTAGQQMIQKRKRGRPKKVASEQPPLMSPDEPFEQGQANPQLKDAPGGLTTNGNSEQPVMGSNVAQSTAGRQMIQKRKRGRPKKVASEQRPRMSPDEPFEQGQPNPQLTDAPGGSTTKGKSEQPAMGSNVAESTAGQQMIQKRKRGRPKKVASEQPPRMSPDEPFEQGQPNPQPTDAPGGSTTNGNTEQPTMGSDVAQSTAGQRMIQKRKRGRPKKDRTSEEPTAYTAGLPIKKRGAPGTKKDAEQENRARARRPWKWFSCQQCLACIRVNDCGKCGQCNAQIGKCILRQCIAPTRADTILLRAVPSDDESLASPESDVSDMEWDVAFPKWRFGALSRKQVWQRVLLARSEVDEADTEDRVCI